MHKITRVTRTASTNEHTCSFVYIPGSNRVRIDWPADFLSLAVLRVCHAMGIFGFCVLNQAPARFTINISLVLSHTNLPRFRMLPEGIEFMKLLALGSVLLLTSLFAFLPVNNDVQVEAIHVCCGSCVDAISDALKGTDGVTNVACDQNTKVASFKASNDEAAEKGIKALSDAGFFGTAKQGKRDLAFPDAGAKKDARSAKIKFSGVHLCCRSCVKDAHTALKDVKGVSSIYVDREAGTVTLNGSDILHTDALAALNKGGFYGKIAE